MKTFADKVRDARRVSTPLIGIGTPDPAATIEKLQELFDGPQAKTPIPLMRWDVAGGLTYLNAAGREALGLALTPGWADMGESEKKEAEKQWPGLTAKPAMALDVAQRLPGTRRDKAGNLQERGTMVFALNLNAFYERADDGNATIVAQSVWNLRDQYKKTTRTLVVLAERHAPPALLRRDVILIDEPLPSDDDLARIVRAQIESVGAAVDEKVIPEAVDAIRSLSAYTAEQVAAMATDENGVDLDSMWEQKIADIERTKGMSVDRIEEDVEDARGVDWFIKFATQLVKGPRCPHVVVRIDEIEKMFGGLSGSGDNTGTTQDTLGVILRKMEDNGWDGNLLIGPPGTGKTLLSKILSKLASKVSGRRVLPIAVDLGDTKSKGLGDTEAAIRDVFKRLESLGGAGRVYFIATCNDLDVLPAALKRRYKKGTWYVDLPSAEGRDQMWQVYTKKFGIDPKSKRPDDRNWTGAEIRNCCENAWSLGWSLVEAAKLVVPTAKSDPAGVEKLRKLADGRFNCVAYEGTYKVEDVSRLNETVPAGRGRARDKEI